MMGCREKNPDCRLCPSFKSGIFSGLSEAELDGLQCFKTTRQFKKGEYIFLEKSPVEGLYCVLSGKVKLYKTTSEGKRQILKVAQGGDVMGHSSVFASPYYMATAEVLEESRVCFWEKSGFLSILQKNLPVMLKLISQLSRDLNRSEDQAVNLAYKSVRVRFAELLGELKDRFGVAAEDGCELDIALSREEMAQAIGSTEETVVRLLSEFSTDGLMRVKKKRLSIINPEKLAVYTRQGY